MGEAFGLGILAQSSLLLAGLLVCWIAVPRRVVGALAGFGAGALIAAVSFDLIGEAEALESWELALWMLVGVAVFLGGDRLVERRFGSEGTGGSMGIVVGSVVDGVPESIIFGIQLATGFPLSPSFLAAVFVSSVAAALGFVVADATGDATGDRMAALAAGGLLAMLTNSLMPFAYERAGAIAGVATVIGFCASLAGS